MLSWRRPGIIAVAAGVAVGSDDGALYVLDAATGRLRWTYTTEEDTVNSGPAVAGGTVYVSDGGPVCALDAG